MLSTYKSKLLGRYAILSERPRRRHNISLKSLRLRPRVNKEAEQTEKLEKAADTNQDTLLEINSVFPFMLFPDSIRIDRQKVMIIHRSFFRVARVTNIQVDELQSIQSDLGPFFGSISITSRQFANTVNKIFSLSRADAVKAQSILQGFVVANKKKIDYSEVEKNKLTQLLEKLGQGVTS